MFSKKNNSNCPWCGCSSEEPLKYKVLGFIPVTGLNIPGVGFLNRFNWFDKIPIALGGGIVKSIAIAAVKKLPLAPGMISEIVTAIQGKPDAGCAIGAEDVGDMLICFNCGKKKIKLETPFGAGQ